MVILDSNVIVGLLDKRDPHARAANADLHQLLRRKQRLVTTTSVLCEVCHLLPLAGFRQRLIYLIERTPIEVVPSPPAWRESLTWMLRYGEHEPDWADVELMLLCDTDPAIRIWSYDREFRTTWRRADGSRIPLAVQRYA